MCHWTKTQDSGLRVTQTGNVSQDTDTGQWKWDRNDRKCVTGHRAVEMRQEWQERCHRTQTHGSGDETGMSGDWQERYHRTQTQGSGDETECLEMRLTGKMSQDTQGSGDETNTDRNDKNGVTGQRHSAVQKRRQEWLEMRQTGMMRRDWQTGMTGDETDRLTGMTAVSGWGISCSTSCFKRLHSKVFEMKQQVFYLKEGMLEVLLIFLGREMVTKC